MLNQPNHSFLWDDAFQAVRNNHSKSKYTIEVSPDNFFDSKIIQNNGMIAPEINSKERF